MNKDIEFIGNDYPTMGVELELQLVNLQNYNLSMESDDFLRRLSEVNCPGEIKPEITQAMIEINSSIHRDYTSLRAEIIEIRNTLAREAKKTHIGICGGGTHPFQHWKEQRIYQTERFANVSQQYGYLAKQFTVFGQHIHIACKNGDDALYLCHAFARYIPQFIALSGASPFSQGIDTSFDCARLAAISAFPLSGTPPWLLKWTEFQEFYEKMIDLGVITSMKDFYWDIRPKPEYGTVELRICDTPLTVDKACQLAAYAQALCVWLLKTRPELSRDMYLTYLVNRFRTARYGLDAVVIDPINKLHIPIGEDIVNTCAQLQDTAVELGSSAAINQIALLAENKMNDASWLKLRYAELRDLSDVVRAQTEKWHL